MENKTWTIKSESLFEFFEKSILNPFNNPGFHDRSSCTPQIKLADEIFIKADSAISAGDTVKFEFEDFTQISKLKPLIIYTYAVKEYDDLGLRLALLTKVIYPNDQD